MQTGLNGWFGRFIKGAIKKVAGLVDSTLNNATMGVSSEIGSFESWADTIGSGGSSFWNRVSNNTSIIGNIDDLANDPRGNYEPTAAEVLFLDAFSDEIALTIVDVTKQQINAFNSNTPIINKYSLFNDILQRIAVIKEYYKQNATGGLSKEAIDLRNLMIEVLFFKIIQEVENIGFENQSFDLQIVSINIPSNDYVDELFPSYRKTKNPLSVNYYQFKEKLKFINPKDEIPIDLIDLIDPIDNDATNPLESTGTDSGTTTTTTTTETPKPKKSGFGGLLAGLLFGATVLIVANSDDDKKKNQKQK
jgi:hypothetical protein